MRRQRIVRWYHFDPDPLDMFDDTMVRSNVMGNYSFWCIKLGEQMYYQPMIFVAKDAN